MKVLNIIEEGRFGGPQKRIADVAYELNQHDINTLVVLPKNDSIEFQNYLTNKKLNFETINLTRLSKSISLNIKFIFRFLFEINEIVRIIKENNIDVVHANGSFQFKGIIAAKKAGIRSVWHLNDSYMPRIILLIFNLISSLYGDKFIAASAKSREYYKANCSNLVKKDIPIIQAGLDTQFWKPQLKNLSTNRVENHTKITMVGNLNYIKGHKTFIRAAATLNKTMPKSKFEFIVAGKFLENQKDYIDEVLSLVKDLNLTNIKFLGMCNNVREVLQDTDIYVCSSESESSPIAVWEALSMGVPVVSTDVGDVKEILEINKCGFVVSVGDFQKLAQKIKMVVEDPNLRDSLSKNARNTAVEIFDIRNCTKLHNDVYRSLILDN